jgi:hypothetical protein
MTHDLMVNLFKGYGTASDKAFTNYIGKKRDRYKEGGNVNANDLMVFAKNKFLLRTENELWNTPTAADKKIIALEAQVDALKKHRTTPSNSNGASKDNKLAWKTIRPKTGEPKKKTAGAKTYHWCPRHEALTIHFPEQCEGKRGKPKEADGPKNQGQRALQLSKALQAVVNDGDEADKDSEGSHK